MKNVKTYEGFWSGGNIHLPWNGRHDDIAKSLLNAFSVDFNYDNLTKNDRDTWDEVMGGDKFHYNHNGMELVIKKDKGFRETNYILKVDGDKKDLNYYVAEKLFKFVEKQWQKKLDEEDRNDTHRIMTNI